MANINVRVRGDWDLSYIIGQAEEINGKKVIVGPTGQRNRDLAKIHEYGVQIPVTAKMRGFLASKGLHLKQTTTFINIPERSFIRNGWDSNRTTIMNRIASDAVKLGEGSLDAEQFLDDTGDRVASLIREFAIHLDNPANHPFTIEQKGFDDPLIESGSMVGSIDYAIE